MKTIGFIDYYLDEWHANNYPALISKFSDGAYEVRYAYGMIDHPNGGMTNKQWAEKYNIALLDTIEEVIEKSDYLIVLSPDNPEMHEVLCDLPLKSGKLVYVDKTFATDKATAERIFANADAHGTKCFSSSALRFSDELKEIDKAAVYKVYSEGPGNLSIYSIHQIEPVICLMQARAKRLMFLGDEKHPSMIIEFEDGRFAQILQRNDEKWSFALTAVKEDNSAKRYIIESDYFGLFIQAMIRFFDTAEVPVPHEQTIDVIAVRAAAIEACKTPFVWIDL